MTDKSPSWLAGYEAGKGGTVASQIARLPEDMASFHVGYMIGARDRRNDDLIDEMERALAGDEPPTPDAPPRVRPAAPHTPRSTDPDGVTEGDG